MKIYLAVSMTNAHNPMLLSQIVDYIHALGHQVLSEHVAAPTKEESTCVLMRNAGLAPNLMPAINPEDLALIIRENDFRWVEECDAFIGLFFGGSDGRGAEFEHLRLLLKLKRCGAISETFMPRYRVACHGILGIFDCNAISHLIWAADHQEQEYYWRVAIDPTDTGAILTNIRMFLSEMEKS